MALILEYKDYAEVHEALEMIDEGWLGNLWNSIVDRFKGISGDVDKAIAGPDIDNLIDPKTGALTNAPAREIKNLEVKINDPNAGADDVKAAIEQTFAKIDGMVKSGSYFKQCLKLMKDNMLTLQDQVGAMKTAGGPAAKTAQEKGKAQGTGSQAASAMEPEMQKQLMNRVNAFKVSYDNAKKKVAASAKQQMDQLAAKSKTQGTKELINNRYATAETVLALIEYDILKLRVGPENLKDIRNNAVQAYKTYLDSAKQLKQQITSANVPQMTPEAYQKLDINAFAKEYPAEQPIAKGGIASDKLVYPYAELETGMGVVITGYDVNEKLVFVQVVGADNKFVASSSLGEKEKDGIPFDEFKEKLLEGNKGVPPIKQKGSERLAKKPAEKTQIPKPAEKVQASKPAEKTQTPATQPAQPQAQKVQSSAEAK